MTELAVGFFWTPPALFDLALMAGTGVIAGIAQYALFEGMRRAPISVIAPFEYTSLVWAFGLGFLIWGDVPGHERLGRRRADLCGRPADHCRRTTGASARRCRRLTESRTDANRRHA